MLTGVPFPQSIEYVNLSETVFGELLGVYTACPPVKVTEPELGWSTTLMMAASPQGTVSLARMLVVGMVVGPVLG